MIYFREYFQEFQLTVFRYCSDDDIIIILFYFILML